jgi:N-acyl-L-homoserine lactone synthetase
MSQTSLPASAAAIIVVEPHDAPEHRHLLDEMFRLRAHVFHDRLRWDVGVTDESSFVTIRHHGGK